MSRLPDAVKVGPVSYNLQTVNRLPDYGLIDLAECTILLRKGMPKDLQAWTVWHEVIHAILYSMGRDSHDEQTVDALAHGILAVLRDNPALRSL